MINSSPILEWGAVNAGEGAAAFFNWAGSGGTVGWFWVMVILCLLPVVTSLMAESTAEKEHGGE